MNFSVRAEKVVISPSAMAQQLLGMALPRLEDTKQPRRMLRQQRCSGTPLKGRRAWGQGPCGLVRSLPGWRPRRAACAGASGPGRVVRGLGGIFGAFLTSQLDTALDQVVHFLELQI